MLDAEALSYHLADLPTRWRDYTPSTRLRAASGVLYTGADYLQAQRVRRTGQRALAKELRELDLIAGPTAVIAAMPVDDLGDSIEPWMRYIHTGYWDAVGVPALTVPMGFTSGAMPLGLHLAGRWFDECAVLQTGDAYQQVTDWHLRIPPVARPYLVQD
jgi:aspartyl-tRNA(Asn)/glutamyl-tRNA(Gln) amidotransferase subunit A